MTKPFFSIVIPTYNRASSLHFAIRSYLLQDFSDFEIIVSDNNSKDKTEEVVQEFKDDRIKYFKNNKNIGAVKNIISSVLKAKGEYIIMHSDDDVILFSDTLSKVYSLIKKKKIGLVRINVLSKGRYSSKIIHAWINEEEDKYLKPKSKSLEIINFFEEVRTSFISGLVFRNDDIRRSDFIDSGISPWIGVLFKQAKKYGAYFMSKSFIISSWSKESTAKIYKMGKDNKLFFDNYFNFIANHILSMSEVERFKYKYSENIRKYSLFLLPAIKYFTNNRNLKAYKNALSRFNKNITSDYYFLFFYYLSLLLPKFIISFIRRNIHFIRRDTKKVVADIIDQKDFIKIEKIYLKILSR